MSRRICKSEALAEGQCLEFELEGEGAEACFLLRYHGRVYAYINRCPHARLPLNWRPDTFFNPEGDLLECVNHGALFRIEDGSCVYGPCTEQALEPIAVVQEEGWLTVDTAC